MKTRRSYFAVTMLAGTLLCVGRPPAYGQDSETRAGEIAAGQEQKARTLSPYKANFLERELIAIDEAGGFGIARGWFVTFGDIKRGSGFSIGPAYSKTFASGAIFEGKAVYSIENAKVAQLAWQAPPLAGDRLLIRTRVRWQDVPEVAFHGIAPGVPESAPYEETYSEVSARALYRPVRLLHFGTGIGFERFQTEITDTSTLGTILFAGAPGAGADPRYIHAYGSAAIDSRDGDGYSRQGTLLRATLHDYVQQNTGPYSFRRVDGDAEQYVPILRGNWVLYFGVRASTTFTDGGETVPFFLLPDLGGGSDLRGFSDYRFRDRHSILATAEYRWYAQEYLDGAIFYDAGKAVPRRGDLDFRSLNSSYGAGIRLHGPRFTVLRVEVARSREGTRLILAFSPVRR
jgi:hypothetical protein